MTKGDSKCHRTDDGMTMESMDKEYGDYSKSQQATFLLVKERVLSITKQKLQDMADNNDNNNNKLVLADFGCADGNSSVFLIKALHVLQEKGQAKQTVYEYTLQDLPGNNWERLENTVKHYGRFSMIDEKANSKSNDNDNHKAMVLKGLKGSFYDKLLDPESVDISLSCMAFQWMDETATELPYTNSVINISNRSAFTTETVINNKMKICSRIKQPCPLAHFDSDDYKYQLLYKYSNDNGSHEIHDEPEFMENVTISKGAKQWNKAGMEMFKQILDARQHELKKGGRGVFLIPAKYYDANMQVSLRCSNESTGTESSTPMTGYVNPYHVTFDLMDEIFEEFVQNGKITQKQKEQVCIPVHIKSVAQTLSVFNSSSSNDDDRMYKQLNLIDLELHKLRNPYVKCSTGTDGSKKYKLDVVEYTKSVKTWSQGLFIQIFGKDISDTMFDMLATKFEQTPLEKLVYDYYSCLLIVEKI